MHRAFGSSACVLLAGILHAQGLGRTVGDLDARYDDAVRARKGAASRTVDLEGSYPGGGSAVGYFGSDGALFLAEVRLVRESGRTDLSLLFQDDSLLLACEWSRTGNGPHHRTDSVARSNGDATAFDRSRTRTDPRVVHFEHNAWSYMEPPPSVKDEHRWIAPQDLIAIGGTVVARLRSSSTSPQASAALDRTALPERPVPGWPLRPDTSLCGVMLHDPVSSVNVLATWRNELVGTALEPFPHASFAIGDGGGSAVFIRHYGSAADEYSEMRLTRADADTSFGSLPGPLAVSGEGIHLGMAMEEAMARLGRSSAVGTSARGRRLLRYAVRDLAASAFLQRYDMPSYYMTLEFDGGGLAEYRFGFEYP